MQNDLVRTPDSAGSGDLLDLAGAMRSLADRAAEEDGRPALEGLVRLATDRVAGARWASLTVRRGRRFTTEAATDDVAARADQLQYDLGSGPGLDAVCSDSVAVTGDVVADERWPEWGQRVNAELGVTSVLSQRLTLLEEESGAVAGLNIYSDLPEAFDEKSRGMGLVLSTHGSLLVTAMLARGRATNLMRALESNREIGVAMGILMQRHQLTREQAFEVLRGVSQDSNRKLSVVATEVADTGILGVSRWPSTAADEAPAV